jgi:hypothetical protein
MAIERHASDKRPVSQGYLHRLAGQFTQSVCRNPARRPEVLLLNPPR